MGADAPMHVDAEAPMLVGTDAPAGVGDASLVVLRVGAPKSVGNGNGPPGEHGRDQRSVSSRRAEERQSVRPPDPGDVKDPSEMERQVRDQLYGPGFRRR